MTCVYNRKYISDEDLEDVTKPFESASGQNVNFISLSWEQWQSTRFDIQMMNFNVILIILFTFCAGVESFTFYRKSSSKMSCQQLTELLYLDFFKSSSFLSCFQISIFCQILLCICSFLECSGRGCPVLSCFILFYPVFRTERNGTYLS